MAKKQESLKKRKKKWYKVIAPKEFKGVSLGESYVDDISLLKGRIFKVSLGGVVNDLKKQNINMSFVVDEIKGDHVSTNIVGYEITSSYIKRLTKKSKTKIEDSFKCVSADGVKLIIKSMILTKNKVNRSISNSLRQNAREYITEFLSKKRYKDFVGDVVSNSLQRSLKEKLNKISPVLICLIRVFKKVNK